ncbi:hypothetical protein N0V83_003414 [Neocucurbitaria cava]|uniref:cyclic pyranopterin monophosphate synthase n=1 Tax=Neocucurbitaria cava TaxID=798079 RepID=A0A9W9CNM7_9PLEO|nr:hypothetical protein N0V83_003414 [Neocucurbitaria cava]
MFADKHSDQMRLWESSSRIHAEVVEPMMDRDSQQEGGTIANVADTLRDGRNMKRALRQISSPRVTKSMFTDIHGQIRQLEKRIAHDKKYDPATDPGSWQDFKKSTQTEMKLGNIKMSAASRRVLWQDWKRNSAHSDKDPTELDSKRQALRDEHEKKIRNIQAILFKYKMHLAAAEGVKDERREELDHVRKQQREVRAKKQELLAQLKELKEEGKAVRQVRATRQPTPTPTIDRQARAESFDVGDILDDAVEKIERTARKLRRQGFAPIDDVEISSVAAKLSAKNRTIQSPTSTAADADSESDTSVRRPSDDLHLQVPASGLIHLDSNLTVNLEAGVADLQSQTLQMQERLKSSYPRLDTLPYDVSTSKSEKTLKTWLKILVSRWQTRFDDSGDGSGKGEADNINEHVKSVMDHMVRDHDLSNEAAERMAKRWAEVFETRSHKSEHAAAPLDWDELDAGGMGFLKDDSASQVSQPSTKEEPRSWQNHRPLAHVKAEAPSFDSLTRRLYSTSSRPPLDLNMSPSSTPAAQSAKSTTATSTAQQPPSQKPPSLPHLTSSGSAHMVSVSAKPHTIRTAIAVGTVSFSNPTPLSLIRTNSLKKGDVLSVSRIAGIMAAKKCPDLIPLCHPISLTHVGVELYVLDGAGAIEGEGCMAFGGVAVEAKVQCTGPTGVEMEALTVVMGAALSVVDMCKAVDKFQRIGDVRVVLKEGARVGFGGRRVGVFERGAGGGWRGKGE